MQQLTQDYLMKSAYDDVSDPHNPHKSQNDVTDPNSPHNKNITECCKRLNNPNIKIITSTITSQYMLI